MRQKKLHNELGSALNKQYTGSGQWIEPYIKERERLGMPREWS